MPKSQMRLDKRMEKAKNFFKKLQSFDLVREVEETKAVTESANMFKSFSA